MPADQVAQPGAVRSALIAVSDLSRSVNFYQELGLFHEIFHEDAVTVLGDESPGSIVLILRDAQSIRQTRHGQQSLGLRSITFNIGTLGELDRIESVLQRHDRFISRQQIVDGASELLRGRDPDNQPLVFVCYADVTVGPDYYRAISSLMYSLDA